MDVALALNPLDPNVTRYRASKLRWAGRLDDYRINPEDPPLWERWAAITTPANAIHHVDLRSPELAAVLQNPTLHVSWVGRTLYETPAPGQEGKITLSVKTVGMMGKVSRYADVISNDTQQPNLKLWLHLEVEKKAENK